jgi:two-component system, OmpR family, alkaline phosphatase synthesis response regulator PhoP
MRILVIEDDKSIRTVVIDALESEGYQTVEAATAKDGLECAMMSDAALVLLDLGLPDRDGTEVLAAIRDSRPTLPVIILTARGSEEDRVKNLRLGADDYITKPPSVRELLARVGAVLRRSSERPADLKQIAIEGGVVDVSRLEAKFKDGKRVELSARELDLLLYLARHKGRVVNREELLRNVWRIDPRGLETRTIDMHIVRLREKLRDDPAEPRVVRTVRGKGYLYQEPG